MGGGRCRRDELPPQTPPRLATRPEPFWPAWELLRSAAGKSSLMRAATESTCTRMRVNAVATRIGSCFQPHAVAACMWGRGRAGTASRLSGLCLLTLLARAPSELARVDRARVSSTRCDLTTATLWQCAVQAEGDGVVEAPAEWFSTAAPGNGEGTRAWTVCRRGRDRRVLPSFPSSASPHSHFPSTCPRVAMSSNRPKASAGLRAVPHPTQGMCRGGPSALLRCSSSSGGRSPACVAPAHCACCWHCPPPHHAAPKRVSRLKYPGA